MKRNYRTFISNPTVPYRIRKGQPGYREVPRRLRQRRRILKAIRRER